MSQVLVTLAQQLARPVAGAGRTPFPRLPTGLLAVAAGGWNDRGLPRVRQEAGRILLLNDTGAWAGGLGAAGSAGCRPGSPS